MIKNYNGLKSSFDSLFVVLTKSKTHATRAEDPYRMCFQQDWHWTVLYICLNSCNSTLPSSSIVRLDSSLNLMDFSAFSKYSTIDLVWYPVHILCKLFNSEVDFKFRLFFLNKHFASVSICWVVLVYLLVYFVLLFARNFLVITKFFFVSMSPNGLRSVKKMVCLPSLFSRPPAMSPGLRNEVTSSACSLKQECVPLVCNSGVTSVSWNSTDVPSDIWNSCNTGTSFCCFLCKKTEANQSPRIFALQPSETLIAVWDPSISNKRRRLFLSYVDHNDVPIS